MKDCKQRSSEIAFNSCYYTHAQPPAAQLNNNKAVIQTRVLVPHMHWLTGLTSTMCSVEVAKKLCCAQCEIVCGRQTRSRCGECTFCDMISDIIECRDVPTHMAEQITRADQSSPKQPVKVAYQTSALEMMSASLASVWWARLIRPADNGMTFPTCSRSRRKVDRAKGV